MPPNAPNSLETDSGEAKQKAEAEDLRQRIEDQFSVREQPSKTMQQFITKQKVNRLTLESLQKLTNDYHKLEELDSQLAVDYTTWLSLVDEQVLEQNDDALAGTKVEALFEEFGEVKDKAMELFTAIAEQYPDHHKVKDYLNFLPKATSLENLPPLPKSSASSVSGKGEAYVRAKIPKIQKTVKDTFASLQSVFAEAPENRSIRIEDIESMLS